MLGFASLTPTYVTTLLLGLLDFVDELGAWAAQRGVAVFCTEITTRLYIIRTTLTTGCALIRATGRLVFDARRGTRRLFGHSKIAARFFATIELHGCTPCGAVRPIFGWTLHSIVTKFRTGLCSLYAIATKVVLRVLAEFTTRLGA